MLWRDLPTAIRNQGNVPEEEMSKLSPEFILVKWKELGEGFLIQVEGRI